MEAIFEPEFKEFEIKNKFQSTNYGFRPRRSAWEALETIKKKSRRCNIVIEGGIVSAYNNVDHKILIRIIEKRVKDKKFIEMLKKMLKSGIMDEVKPTHSLINTPRGGVLSSLLFNIYLFGFDQFVYNEIIQPINLENKEKLKQNPILQKTKKVEMGSREYKSKRYRKQLALQQLKKARENNATSKVIKEKIKFFEEANVELLKTPYSDIKLFPKKAVYARYIDVWVLALTTTKAEAKSIKQKMIAFFFAERKMKLDKKKINILSIVDGYKFLGFEIRMIIKKPKLMKVLTVSRKRGKKGKCVRGLKRIISRKITIEPDSERLLKKLKYNEFCDEKYFPIGKKEWLIYDEYQIVEKFRQVLEEIYNYYRNADSLRRLHRISYILHYSCAKTLARRKKMSLKQIFGLYTKKLRVNIETQKGNKFIEFLDIVSLKKIEVLRKEKSFQKGKILKKLMLDETIDRFRIEEYWRTKYKLYVEYCICRSIYIISFYHINIMITLRNKIKDPSRVIKSQLKRKQIPICFKCHFDIIRGRYDNKKKPAEFHNEFVAKL